MTAAGEWQHSSCYTEDTVQSSNSAKEEETGLGTAQQLLPCDSKCGTVSLHWLLKKFNWDGATGGTTLSPVMSLLLQHWQVNTYLVWGQKVPALNQFLSKPTELHRWGRAQHMGWQSTRTGQEVQGKQWCFAELCRVTAPLLSRILMLYFTFQHQIIKEHPPIIYCCCTAPAKVQHG